MLIESIIFYLFAVAFAGTAVMVVISRNTVHSALFLVLTFFCAAALWLFLEAEFLALILILVYVGAVMTLFLFVVMMLDLDLSPNLSGFVRYLPVGMLIIASLAGAMIYVIGSPHFSLAQHPLPAPEPGNYSNVQELGMVLYTRYVYPFEIAAVLLLVAIISAISLSLRKPRGKKQNVAAQLRAGKENRLRIVNMPVEKSCHDE